jgi:hypothetical protein
MSWAYISSDVIPSYADGVLVRGASDGIRGVCGGGGVRMGGASVGGVRGDSDVRLTCARDIRGVADVRGHVVLVVRVRLGVEMLV